MKKSIKVIVLFLLVIMVFSQIYFVNAYGSIYEAYKKKYYKDNKWSISELLKDKNGNNISEKDYETIIKNLRSEQFTQLDLNQQRSRRSI